MLRSKTRATAWAILCLGALLVALQASAALAQKASEAAPYSLLQTQIAKGQITAATFNKKAHTVHVTLSNGHHELVSYPSHDEPQLAAQLQSKGAAVKIRKPKKKAAVHHKLRYIAAGVLVVVVVVVAVVLGMNRRRQTAGPEGARTDAPVAGGPDPQAGGPEPHA